MAECKSASMKDHFTHWVLILLGSFKKAPNGNKWIMTVVCPYSNFLSAIPVLDKSATTAARAFFDHVLLLYGFPSVLQSDRGGE